MKPLENIFSKNPGKTKKIKEKSPNPNIKIIIDTREKQSFIAANLFKQNANIEFETLDIGDYLIKDTIIERKTFPDFVSSMINKRLFEQLTNLKKYEKYFLILEGFDYKYKNFNVHENAIKGMLISIAIDYQVPIIFTKDEKDTVSFLILTAKKYERPKPTDSLSIRQSKTHKTLKEQKQFILEGFPGVGPTTAKSLLEKFNSLQNIFNATDEQLKETPKFNETKIKKFKELLS